MARDEGVRRVDQRNALEIDMGTRELRHDVIHVVRHAAQDGIRDIFGGVATGRAIAMEFLDPFEVDHRDDADEQIDVTRDIDRFGLDRTVQPFVEEQVGIPCDVFPGRERARCLTVRGRFFGIVQVLAAAAMTMGAIIAKQRFEFFEEVCIRAEMAETQVPALGFLGQALLHLVAVVTVKRITLDEGCVDALASENLLKRAHHRRGAGTRGPGDGYDGV